MLIRVPKSEIQKTAFIKPDGLAICLDHWIEWMQRDDRDLGAKSQGCIKSGPDSEHEGYDVNAAAEAAESRAARQIAMATDAMIDSLDRHHKAAIYRRCSISTLWRYPNMDYCATLPDAEEALKAKLSKNVATRVFF